MEKGDLILLDFTATVKDTGNLIETTIQEEAKKLKKEEPDHSYEPKLIAIGEGWVLKGLDDILSETEIEKNTHIEIPPEKGFGKRDPSKIRLLPIRKFGDKIDKLEIGSEIDIDGRIGIVRFIGSGRVQMDFNHRYAGKTLEYNFTIRKKLEDKIEKIQALVDRRIPQGKEKIEIKVENSTTRITIPEEYFLIDGLQIIKKALSNELMKYVNDLKKISFIEEFKSDKINEQEKSEELEKEDVQVIKEKEEKEDVQVIKEKEEKEDVQVIKEKEDIKS